jgi:hypothetical protein
MKWLLLLLGLLVISGKKTTLLFLQDLRGFFVVVVQDVPELHSSSDVVCVDSVLNKLEP